MAAKKKKRKKKTKSSKSKSTKNSLMGVEIELFTLDHNGHITSGADTVMKKVKKTFPKADITKECGKSMIEIRSSPYFNLGDTIEELLKHLECSLYCAEKEGLKIFPLGTYPGKNNPEMRKDKTYNIKRQILGERRFKIAGRCIGFHCHYTLPRGVFNLKHMNIRNLVYSKHKQSMVDSYNLLIAIDPALTTFMQSSPYYESKHFSKDCRVVVYRGGDIFNYPEGLYANLQPFGALQPYKHTGMDLMYLISSKYSEWKSLLKKVDVNFQVFTKYGSVLDTNWNPVKINAHGTLEQRGMDMNYPSNILAVTTLIKTLMRTVQKRFIKVVPSDIGIHEPFKLEGSTLYIPPHIHVRKFLQRAAALYGLNSNVVNLYCKNLFKLAKEWTPKGARGLLDPLKDMIMSKKTISDEILHEVKKRGVSMKKPLPADIAADIAIRYSDRLFKEMDIAKKMIEISKAY